MSILIKCKNTKNIILRKGAYKYVLLIDICDRNPMFGKYSLQNLQGQEMRFRLLALSLN